MSDRIWHEIWMEQCEAAETVNVRHGAESAFDYVVGEKLQTFAQAMPRFVSRVRGMFTAQEMESNLARIEGIRRKNELTAVEAYEPDLDDPMAAAERARQFELVKELLTAPLLGTS